MKISLSLVLLFALWGTIAAQTNCLLNENFGSGIPASWTQSGVSAASKNNKTCVSMGTNAYLIAPVVSKPGSLTFAHRASGNGKTLKVEKSIDNGAWIVVGDCSPSSSSGWGSSSFSVNDANNNVRIRFSATSGTIYITDIQLSALPNPVFELGSGETDFGKVFGGETSSSHLFYLTAMYVEGDVTVEVIGEGFEVSANNEIFSQQVSVPVSKSGTGFYYVRYQSPAIPVGEVRGTVILTANGAEPISFEVKAYSAEPEPTIFVSPKSLNFGYVLFNDSSMVKKVVVDARYLTEGTITLAVKVDEPFEVSLSESGSFSDELELNLLSMSPLPLQFFVRFRPCCNSVNESYTSEILIAGGGTSETVAVSGIGVTSMDGIAKHYYISPSGNDITGEGSFDQPWYNLSKAVAVSEAGDTVHCRGGVYNFDQTIRLSTSGTLGKRICIFAYQNDDGTWEEPVFDFSNQPYGANNRAILITGNYWYLFGIHITKAGDNGIKLEGNYCIIERCVFSYNGDTGIQLGFGHDFSDSHPGISKNDGSFCAYNVIVDCDSYQNYDPDNYGSDADGFACKMHNGLQNWFLRCRAWNNSDDAWDLYETDYLVHIIECWGFHSGDASQHPVSGGSFQGNGNGIKMGGNGSGGSSEGKHEAWHSVAFNNNKTNSVKGFDQNSHKGGVKVVNCLAYNNGYDFMFEDAPSGTTNDFYNNVCLSNRIEINATGAIMQNNAAINNPSKGWINPVNVSFSAGDYTELSEDAAKMPRPADGSLPTAFARLVSTSKLIDMGKSDLVCPMPIFLDQPLVGSAMDLVQPIKGNARDLGPYESDFANGLPTQLLNKTSMYIVADVPGCLHIKYSSDVTAKEGELLIYNLNGQIIRKVKLKNIENGVGYSFLENQLNEGVYLVSLKINGACRIAKACVVGSMDNKYKHPF